jgi:hypothetical protein
MTDNPDAPWADPTTGNPWDRPLCDCHHEPMTVINRKGEDGAANWICSVTKRAIRAHEEHRRLGLEGEAPERDRVREVYRDEDPFMSFDGACVYVVQQGVEDAEIRAVKIGATENLVHRLGQLQVANPHKLYPWAVLPVPKSKLMETEAAVLEELLDIHVRGEWVAFDFARIVTALLNAAPDGAVLHFREESSPLTFEADEVEDDAADTSEAWPEWDEVPA